MAFVGERSQRADATAMEVVDVEQASPAPNDIHDFGLLRSCARAPRDQR
jgi:hypothetical protein